MAKRDMPVKEEPKRNVENHSKSRTDYDVDDDRDPFRLVVANCTNLNVRQGASREAKILCQIPVGTVVLVDGMEKEWLHISGFGDDEKKSEKSLAGYILAQYTKEG